ncbi:hypothetical protein SLA_1387 [Streptomyces laurentii]|uniref:Alkaline shock response membrane anchor protein AmaP n=1 Tax=Streptomyces laurentii TaxID=39478 RepID=A0A160NWG8_STRLU|nr:hypothetical protein SLA_1387 [Streptomyces laurentii]
MPAVLRRVNRIVLALAGVLLVVGGGAVLAAGLGLSVPSWWPWSGPHDVLLSRSERQHWRSEGWWWPAVIAALGVVVLLALWWLIAQFRRARLAEVVVDSGDGEGAVVRGRALEAVLAADTEAQEGVARARIALTGRRVTPAPGSPCCWSHTPPRPARWPPSPPGPSATPVPPPALPPCPPRPASARSGTGPAGWRDGLSAAGQKPLRAPPSTGSIRPVRYEAAGERRNAAVRPNSSGVP